MFYCDDCAEEYHYPETLSRSFGTCECCGLGGNCNNMPSSALIKHRQAHEQSRVAISPPSKPDVVVTEDDMFFDNQRG